ncbi:MAG: CPBP family intramembrane metalloprotease [Bacteroidales bacterium]|nr:CPBP family intramembrane metalloprotease [Bacteroidales bacterium]
MKFFLNARQGRNHWLLYLALICIGYTVAQIPSLLIIPIIALKIKNHELDIEALNPNTSDFLSRLTKITETIFSDIPGFSILMLCFVAWFLTTFLLFKPLHKRDKYSLISGENKFRKNLFLWSLLLNGVIIILTTIPIFISNNCTFQFDGYKYILFFTLCLILVPFQTGCEELIFRGYLMQGFAMATKSKIWALVITSVIFGLLHCANMEVLQNGFFKSMPVYILIGGMLGFFAIISDGLEFSFGFHFINNFLLFTIFGTEGSTGNLKDVHTLLTTQAQPISWENYVYPIITTIILYFIFRKKFNWNIKKAFSNEDLKCELPSENIVSSECASSTENIQQ